MYDLEEVRLAVDELWHGLRDRLRDAGVVDAPDELRWIGDLYDDHWLHPQLLLSQSCGWPIVDRLAARVTVVGAFTYAGVSTPDARYRSVLVTRADDVDIALPGRRVAVNGYDSLSGWVSLRAAVNPLGPVIVTGAHVRSVEAVRSAAADLACIDGVTWALLQRHRPDAVAGLAVVGHGPDIPCLPLITTPSTDIAALRAALAGVRNEVLLIDGFQPLDAGDYDAVRGLGDVWPARTDG
jgi:ABC-type phosphate/phosphonate transport system substrate-binding protein